MKALFLALLLAGCCPGCATAPEKATEVVAVSENTLRELLYYAQGVQDITIQLCRLDREGKPCRFLIIALDNFYSRAEQVETAMNNGEDVTDRIKALLAEARALYRAGQDFLKGMA